MKLSLTQENLAKALSTVGRVVNARGSLPVLANVFIGTDKKRLKVAATNLEVGIVYRIGCKIDEEGSLTIPARLFSEFVSSLPSGNIELSSSDLSLQIKTHHYESQINGISAEEFPLIPEIKTEPALILPAADLKEAIAQVVGAASMDEARPVLAGVYMHIADGMLVVVATDSYRLAEKKLKLTTLKKDDKLSVILPAKTMSELARILAETTGEVKVYLSENQVMFETENVELTSRLIEGQFPNYQQIIPESSLTDVVIDTDEFSQVTKVAGLFARENAGSVRLEVKEEGRVDVVANASQVGDNTSSADCEVTGEDGEISLNARYLTEALAAIKTDQVEFSISGKLNPCVIRPVEEKGKPDYLHIIMPLRT